MVILPAHTRIFQWIETLWVATIRASPSKLAMSHDANLPDLWRLPLRASSIYGKWARSLCGSLSLLSVSTEPRESSGLNQTYGTPTIPSPDPLGKERSRRRCWRIVKGARRGHRSGEGTRRAAPKAHRLRCPMLGMAGITAHRPPCRMNLGRCRRGTICLIQSTSWDQRHNRQKSGED